MEAMPAASKLHLQNPPVVETFPPYRKRLQFQLSTQQDVGCAQFETENEDRLIRVPRNRFAYHWPSKAVTQETIAYPSYDANQAACLDEFAIFSDCCEAKALGPIQPLLCEVMYLNYGRNR